MNFNYNEQEYEEFPNFKGGEKSLYAKMFHDDREHPSAYTRMRLTVRSSISQREQAEFLWMGNMRNWKRVCVIIVRRDIPTAS